MKQALLVSLVGAAYGAETCPPTNCMAEWAKNTWAGQAGVKACQNCKTTQGNAGHDWTQTGANGCDSSCYSMKLGGGIKDKEWLKGLVTDMVFGHDSTAGSFTYPKNAAAPTKWPWKATASNVEGLDLKTSSTPTLAATLTALGKPVIDFVGEMHQAIDLYATAANADASKWTMYNLREHLNNVFRKNHLLQHKDALSAGTDRVITTAAHKASKAIVFMMRAFTSEICKIRTGTACLSNHDTGASRTFCMDDTVNTAVGVKCVARTAKASNCNNKYEGYGSGGKALKINCDFATGVCQADDAYGKESAAAANTLGCFVRGTGTGDAVVYEDGF